MPFVAETFEPEGAEQLIGNNGGSLDKSLFSPIYKGDFSSQDERDIAVYMDGDSALKWWHRNVARSHYAVQGWRREKIYPDFIFAVQHGEVGSKLVVLEMKGQHLAGNTDTTYKQSVLRLMSDAFDMESTPRVGELELVDEDGTTVECDLVLMPEWKARLPKLIK
jgi:type III restriction enzyme